MRMTAQLRAKLQVRLSPRAVFGAPTVARFAGAVDAAVAERDGAGVG
ncbi:phosphopantetheine-binding protein [Streptomyces anulatus]